jgi:hypothetical protein
MAACAGPGTACANAALDWLERIRMAAASMPQGLKRAGPAYNEKAGACSGLVHAQGSRIAR